MSLYCEYFENISLFASLMFYSPKHNDSGINPGKEAVLKKSNLSTHANHVPLGSSFTLILLGHRQRAKEEESLF